MKWGQLSVSEIKQKVQGGLVLTQHDIDALKKDGRKGLEQVIRHAEWMQAEMVRLTTMMIYERELAMQNKRFIAGVDEVGRGPLAGPVVTAAVILPQDCYILGLNDSKKIPENKRFNLEREIKEKALAWAVGAMGPRDIDKYNILQATFRAMKRALNRLKIPPDHLLVDAVHIPGIDIAQTAIIKGDAKSVSIAAASILAKCHRDRLMDQYHQRFPGYGLDRNKGYPTPEHIACIRELGITVIHRKTFVIHTCI